MTLLERLRHLEDTISRMQEPQWDPTATPVPETHDASSTDAVRLAVSSSYEQTTSFPTASQRTAFQSVAADPDINATGVGIEFGKLALSDGRSRYVTSNSWASLDAEVGC